MTSLGADSEPKEDKKDAVDVSDHGLATSTTVEQADASAQHTARGNRSPSIQRDTSADLSPLSLAQQLVSKRTTTHAEETQSSDIISDTTRIQLLQQQNNELLRLRASERESIKLRSSFLDIISYDIRIPLTTLLTDAELLSQSGLSVPQLAQVAQIMQCGFQIRDIIMDLLDNNQMEVGQLVLECRLFSLYQLLADINAANRTQIEAKGVQFIIERPTTDMLVYGDMNRAKQILRHLLSNARKFTNEGSIRLSCTTRTTDVDNPRSAAAPTPASGQVTAGTQRVPSSQQLAERERVSSADDNVSGGAARSNTPLMRTSLVTFTVRDTGVGIAKDRLELLRLYLMNQKLPKGYSFNGLGLKVCTQLVALMHGRMEIDSTTAQVIDGGHAQQPSAKTTSSLNTTMESESSWLRTLSTLVSAGTEVRVVLPFSNAYDQNHSTALEEPAYMRQTTTLYPQCKILIADDDDTNLICLQKILNHLGYKNIVAVDDGLTAQAQCVNKGQFDMILLDDYMPYINGTELCRQIRQRDSEQIIIIISANVVHAKDYFNFFGSNDFIPKPFTLQQLQRTLFKWETVVRSRCSNAQAGSS